MTHSDTSLVFTPVAKVGDVAVGSAVKIEICGFNIVLFNLDGAYYATDEICTHAHASLAEGFIDDGTVECPLHGSCFSIKTGQALTPPATDPLTTYPLRVENGNILIGVPR